MYIIEVYIDYRNVFQLCEQVGCCSKYQARKRRRQSSVPEEFGHRKEGESKHDFHVEMSMPKGIISTSFTIEYPHHTKRLRDVPEVDEEEATIDAEDLTYIIGHLSSSWATSF